MSMSHHAAPTGRRVSPPPPSSPSAPPTERPCHGDGSTVQATAVAASTVIGATARWQERCRSGRCSRSGSGRPSLNWAPVALSSLAASTSHEPKLQPMIHVLTTFITDPVHPHETTASRLSRPCSRRSTALSLHNRRSVHPTPTPAAAAHASLALHAPGTADSSTFNATSTRPCAPCCSALQCSLAHTRKARHAQPHDPRQLS